MENLICNSRVTDDCIISDQSALAELLLSKNELIEIYESLFVSVDAIFSCRECKTNHG